jgi:hypothetical protein
MTFYDKVGADQYQTGVAYHQRHFLFISWSAFNSLSRMSSLCHITLTSFTHVLSPIALPHHINIICPCAVANNFTTSHQLHLPMCCRQ